MKRQLYLSAWLLFACCAQSLAQTRTVTGTVSDDGGPLPGASIVLKGTTTGTQSDPNGRFQLAVPGPEASLIISFLGYTPKEVVVGNRTEINETLQADVQTLDQLVVVGYGIQRKADVTGSIASVKAEEIANRPVLNAQQALQGKASGVLVTSNQGTPGDAPLVRIRGVSTVGNSNPLYVVDGMFVDDINYLNSADIENISVLKDASSLAIYGVRGANGVIVITTRGGKAGVPAVSYEGYAGFSQVQNQIRMANAEEYVTLNNEARQNQGITELIPAPTANTRWFDEVFRRGPIQNHQFTVSGGSDKLTFNVSTSYFKQAGILKTSDYERITLRFNNTYQATSFLKLGNNLAFSRFQSNNVPGSVAQNAYLMPSNVPVRNADGSFGSALPYSTVANPVAQLAYNNSRSTGGRLVGNLFGEVSFLKNFTFRSSFGVDLGLNKGFDYVPVYQVSASQFSERSSLTRYQAIPTTWLWENTLTFNKSFNEFHNLTALVGYTTQETRSELLSGRRLDVPSYSRDVQYLDLGNSVGQTNANNAYVFTYLSYLFRVNYTLLDKYLLTASFRRDASSRFSANNRFGNFPAVGIGWRIDQENFMKNQGFITNLKLRASYGLLGNTNIPDYQIYSDITPNLDAVFGQGQTLQQGATVVDLTTSDLRWEEITQADVGFEVGALNNRLTLEADYYNRLTSEMAIRVTRDRGDEIFENAASARNRGFEFSTRWNDKIDGFSYGVSANLTTVDNEVTSLGNGGIPIIGGGLGNGQNAGLTDVGRPIGAFYGYRTVGVFQTSDQVAAGVQPTAAPGDLIFQDINNDGRIDANDRVLLGSPIPRLFWGFNTNFAYRGVDLSVDLQGTHGNQIYNGKRAVRFGNENYEADFLNRWTAPNTSNTFPRSTSGTAGNYQVSSFFIESGSFVRIRNVQLGYRLPKKVLDKVKLKTARVYVNALNPLTFTNYSGFSPEVGSNTATPSPGDLSRGVSSNNATASGADLSRGVDLSIIPVFATYTIGLNIGL